MLGCDWNWDFGTDGIFFQTETKDTRIYIQYFKDNAAISPTWPLIDPIKLVKGACEEEYIKVS